MLGIFRLILLNLILWIVTPVGFAQSIPKARTKPVETTLCAIIEQPGLFDGQILRLKAIVNSGFETFSLRSPTSECLGSIWLTYAGGGPQASVSMRTKTPITNRAPITLRRDSEFAKFQKLLQAEIYSRDRGSLCIACKRYEVTATFTGRLDVANGDTGFGHLNAYPAQLVLQSIALVTWRDLSDKYDPALFSAKPVRFPTGYFSGRVIGPDGKPVDGIDVAAISIEDVPLYLAQFEDSTDEKGRFNIEVPPGRYVIGINVSSPPSPRFPFAPLYAPGTQNKEGANQFRVSDRQRLNLGIRIHSKLMERRIPVRVVWPGGSNVPEANVWLAEEDDSDSVVGGTVSHTEADGEFELVGFEGVSYILRASIYARPDYIPFCAPRRLIKATELIQQEILLTLTITGEVCRGSY